jgi:hypothetical protein
MSLPGAHPVRTTARGRMDLKNAGRILECAFPRVTIRFIYALNQVRMISANYGAYRSCSTSSSARRPGRISLSPCDRDACAPAAPQPLALRTDRFTVCKNAGMRRTIGVVLRSFAPKKRNLLIPRTQAKFPGGSRTIGKRRDNHAICLEILKSQNRIQLQPQQGSVGHILTNPLVDLHVLQPPYVSTLPAQRGVVVIASETLRGFQWRSGACGAANAVSLRHG